MERICIFVDGENLRHSICDLFNHFDQAEYLPKADWAAFFNFIAESASEREEHHHVRTYWYVVRDVDYRPYNLPKDTSQYLSWIEQNFRLRKRLRDDAPANRNEWAKRQIDSLYETRREFTGRFDGWTTIQRSITYNHDKIEFRRAGSLKFDLIDKQITEEKAVDVKLATDLILLKGNFDTAIIVSGDQDYVPAVQAIKDLGKRAVNITFKTRNGKLLPGGAIRLNQITDSRISIEHGDAKRFLFPASP